MHDLHLGHFDGFELTCYIETLTKGSKLSEEEKKSHAVVKFVDWVQFQKFQT